jgi:hypothetical protein
MHARASEYSACVPDTVVALLAVASHRSWRRKIA